MYDHTGVFVDAHTTAQFISATLLAQNISASGSQNGVASPQVVVPRNVVAIRPEITIVAAGAQGPPGSAQVTFSYTQAVPALVWVVVHNLNKHPSVTVVDSGGGWVIGDVQYDSLNQCTLTFTGEFSGSAYFN